MKILLLQTNYPKFLESFYIKHPNWENLTYDNLKKIWANEYFGHSDFYLKNLEKYGWKGDEVILNDWNTQSLWTKENGIHIRKNSLPFSEKLPEPIKNMLGLRAWFKQIMFWQIEKIKPDVVYNFDLSALTPWDIKKIKIWAKLLVGQIAYPFPLNKYLLGPYDLIISSFPHYVSRFREMGIKSEYLAWCFEDTILNKIKAEEHKKIDVAYIGGMSRHHSQGNKILEEVADKTKIDFWGYLDSTVTRDSVIRKSYHGDNAWGIEMFKIFAKSKIVINRHIDISLDYANNMRLFEATGMGALLITDDKKNIKDFFEPGKEVVTYKNSNDLSEKIKYYLKNDKERLKIAAAGQKRTLKNHTYKIRMEQLDLILKTHLHEV